MSRRRRTGAGRWLPSSLAVMRVGAALLALSVVAFWVHFHLFMKRTIVIEAETGALEIALDAELSGKAFRELWTCERVDAGNRPAPDPPADIGCPSRTHHLVGPARVATPVLPAGAALEITTRPGMLRIDVVSLPERYRGTDAGRLEGGALVLAGRAALDAFGTLPLSGEVRIGALFSQTDRMSVAAGRYRIRGYTPTGLAGGDMRELRGGALLAGARVRFVDREGGTARGHVAVMLTDPEGALMRVTAISEHAPTDLAVRYYFTEEVVLRPSFLETLILDPLLQLLATVFGAIAGYGWLKRLLSFGGRGARR